MKSRWLTLIAALGFALTLSGQAIAKPPEEEAIDRAEKAAERAAKAAERAAEAAERAAEREARDKTDKAERDAKGSRDRSGGGKDSVELVQVKSGDDSKDTSKASGSGESQSSGGDDSGGSTSTSGSTSGGSGDDKLSGSDDSGSNSSGDDDDHSGSNSGSGGSDDDDDDGDDDSSGKGSGDDDDNKNGGQKFGIIPVESDSAGNPYREGELVVMSDDVGLVSRAQALGFGVIEQRPLESIGAVVARLRRPEGVTSDRALELLRTSEPASASGYNYLYRATGKPPEDGRQDVPALPKTNPKGKTMSVGVIDGFASDTVGGWKVDRLIDKPAMSGHGDAVTGILLRDLANAYGAEPDRLMLLDVMRGKSGAGAADVAALVFAFDRLVTNKVGVVNLSLAGPDHPALQRAVSQSLRSGMVVVAAVGNAGPAAPPAFPAAYDGVIGVSAVDNSGKPYLYSGRGAHVDIAALGVEVSDSAKGGELIGTSYAAPHVTAMIAGEQKRHKGNIETLLTEFAEDAGAPGRDPVYGLGILTLDKPARLAQAAAHTSN